MLLYNRYISSKVFAGFGAFVAVLIALIWFSRAMVFVSYVTENGIELSKFFYLFILILPWILLFIIPVSLFAGILMTYNRMIASNEITILKNSGLTKFALCKPALAPIIFSVIFCFITSFYLMPFANKELRISRTNFANNYANLSFNPKTFETLKNLTIYARERDSNNQLFGILLHDERSEKKSITITAQSGNINSDGNASLLYMKDGTIQKFNYENQKSEILHFDNYVFNLTEGQKDESNKSWKAKERYFNELLFPEENISDSELAKFRAEINKRITNPLLPIIFALIGLSCILRGKFNRSGNFSNIIIAVAGATIFMISVIVICDLIESSAKYVPLLYLDLMLFTIIAFTMLRENYRKK